MFRFAPTGKTTGAPPTVKTHAISVTVVGVSTGTPLVVIGRKTATDGTSLMPVPRSTTWIVIVTGSTVAGTGLKPITVTLGGVVSTRKVPVATALRLSARSSPHVRTVAGPSWPITTWYS